MYGIKEARPRLEEELEAERFHLPRKYFRFFDIVLYGGGVAAIAYGVDNMALGLVASDADSVSKGTKALFVGLGILLWKTGDYLDRIEIGNPPPKPERKLSIEWLRRLLPASSNS
ncbi:hypothetical protein HYY71_04975 [Candidatus Woesearchaeota archaeon]|nr:hypothetical protein [Candidatus Woesearchaeota archaeon]